MLLADVQQEMDKTFSVYLIKGALHRALPASLQPQESTQGQGAGDNLQCLVLGNSFHARCSGLGASLFV